MGHMIPERVMESWILRIKNLKNFKRFQNPPMKTEKYAKFGINFK